jgi:prepilin peptidase CpaA
MMLANAVVLLLFPALMAFAACSDFLTMTISNRVALALIGGFFVAALMTGMGTAAVVSHVSAGLVVLVLGFACFARGWIGGGDAKLAAGTALWLGFDHAFAYLLWASVFGGILTVAVVYFRTMPLPQSLERQDWALRLHKLDAGIPYGIALAVAALMIYPDTSYMHAVAF